jgi:hypothetical protein
MQDTPPRRARRSGPGKSGSGFPLIPIVLGTIVIGFVIGAGLSVVGRHGAQRVAFAPPSPAVETTLAPATLAPATLAPATLAPATPAPATKRSREPRQAPATASAPPPSVAKRVPAHAPPAVASREPATPVTSRATPSSAEPSAERSAEPATPEAAATDDADTDFGRLAAGVVRGYLAAVSRGDTAAAAAALANAKDSVTESAIVDASTHINHVEARGAGDAATVNVDFETSSGPYSGQFTVRRNGTGAAVIVAHTIIKV